MRKDSVYFPEQIRSFSILTELPSKTRFMMTGFGNCTIINEFSREIYVGMKQTAKNSLLEIVDGLNVLMYKHFPHEQVGNKFCYINKDGEYMLLHDVNYGEYVFFEYASNREAMEKDITTDGGWFYVQDYPDAESLFKDVVIQANGSVR